LMAAQAEVKSMGAEACGSVLYASLIGSNPCLLRAEKGDELPRDGP